MIAENLLCILRCPQDRSSLRNADQATIDRVNRLIAAGRVTNRAGEKVDRPIDGGLVREAGDLLYPVYDQIPVLLADEAFDLGALGQA